MNISRVIGAVLFAAVALVGCAQSPERDIRPATDGSFDRGVDVSLDTAPDRGSDVTLVPDADDDSSSGPDANPCDSNLSSCSGACVNINTNVNHCGACGHECGQFYRCLGGECVCTDTRRC